MTMTTRDYIPMTEDKVYTKVTLTAMINGQTYKFTGDSRVSFQQALTRATKQWRSYIIAEAEYRSI